MFYKIFKATCFLCFYLFLIHQNLEATSNSALSMTRVPTTEIDMNPSCTLLITGSAKSGTMFIAELLKKSGHDINHEAYGKDGCASWAMAKNRYNAEKSIETLDSFTHIFHQVRHPLSVISSLVAGFTDFVSSYDAPLLSTNSWLFILEHVPEINEIDSHTVIAAKYYYYWNLLAEKKAEWRYQIEIFNEIIPEFMARSGLTVDINQLSSIPTDCNTWLNGREKLTWSKLKKELPDDLYHKIQEMASRYDYIIKDLQ